MIVFEDARPADLSKLTTLWQTCFGDSSASIRLFWESLFPHSRVFLARCGKAVGAMVCALPVSLIDESGESHCAAYLYALCTAPELRRQGLCRKLLEHTEASLQHQGIEFTLLVPSMPSLFAFYETLGYHTAFYHQRKSLSAQKEEAKITFLDAEGYRNLREMLLYSDFVSYDIPLLQYQQRVSKISGAGIYRIELDAQIFCAAAEKNSDTLIIKELLPYEPSVAAALAYSLGCAQVQVRGIGTDYPFGMVKALSSVPTPKCAYLGLAFD